MIGFLDCMKAFVRLNNDIEQPLTTSEKSPRSVTKGLLKLVRSFPEEKLPPYPVKTINLMLSMFCAELIASVKVKYMSMLNALYLFGRLYFMFILEPLTSTIMFLLFYGTELKISVILLKRA